jgi:hypothetical protein
MRAAAAALLFAAAGIASAAQVFYKWTDNDGRIQFSDKPPVAFKGEVTRILVEDSPQLPAAPAAGSRPAPKAKPAVDEDEREKPADMNSLRRAKREGLEMRLAAARASLEAAQKALADGEEPGEAERQFVQERLNRDARRPERTPAPRSNCMSRVSSDGKAIWICPRPIPNEAYYTRREKLEEAVRKAEEDVAEAERAYRRGVD